MSNEIFLNLKSALSGLLVQMSSNKMFETMTLVLETFLHQPMNFTDSYILNFVLYGGAGSGKTSFVEKVAGVFAALNLVIAQPYNEDTESYVIKTSYANDFLGQYVGQTSPKTYSHLLQNLDTVVFVDEAYAITDG